jgi:3',5'-cyclic AMP phosphodiesterase CpdA
MRSTFRSLLAVGLSALALGAPHALAHEGHSHEARELAPWHAASPWPDRIVVTFAADPARTLAVNWRTDASVEITRAQIALATPDARFDLAAQTVTATTEPLDLAQVPLVDRMFEVTDNAGLPRVHYHSVVFPGLTPDTLYAYRVQGADGLWSEWFQVRTAPESGPISFIYLGDAQNGILSHWARVVRAAFQKAPEARFILHAGDLVDKASKDYEWAQWFKAVGFIHGMIPAIPVAGNHEYYRIGATAEDTRRALSILWRPQFRLPTEPTLPAVLQETVYQVRYSQDLDVFVLDTNQQALLAEQAAWLDARLAASTARWKVVTMHHPVFSSGRDRDNANNRAAILPVLRKHKVDLVLQGHDHTYARGAVPHLVPEAAAQTPERVAAVADGEQIEAMFVNSVSGAKQYDFSASEWTQYAPEGVVLDRLAENTQFFQVISIDGETLSYRAYTADGQLYDAFTMEKSADGLKTLREGPASAIETRRFDNSMPYPGTDGLNN